MPFHNSRTITLGELGDFANGVNFSKDAMGTGWGLVNVKDIFRSGIRLDFNDLDKVDVSGNRRKESYSVAKNDLFFVRSSVKRDGIGLVSYSPSTEREVVHCGFVIRLRVRDSSANPVFLAYALRSPYFREVLKSQSSGTAIINISQQGLGSIKIDLPPAAIQTRIVEILSRYDDLIENNTRRIKILEETAQMIYREWFVNFRFPRHGGVQKRASEMGAIPQGWRVGILQDAVVLQRGFDLPAAQRQPGSVPIFAATGINGTHSVAKVKGPGVVTGRSGSLGVVLLVLDDFWPLNTTLWVKEFRQSTPAHAYFVLKDLRLSGFNSGAAVPTLNRNDIHNLPTILPERKVLDAFNDCVMPLFLLQGNLKTKNANLRKTRDILLPKLISGEISVEQSEAEAVAQSV